VGELAEHQAGEFPEHFSLGLGEFIEARQIPVLRLIYTQVDVDGRDLTSLGEAIAAANNALVRWATEHIARDDV
jgi:hypothetical protein